MHLQVNGSFDLNVIVNYFEQLCIDEIKYLVHFFSRGAFNCNEIFSKFFDHLGVWKSIYFLW
jgi:hypothetical protein